MELKQRKNFESLKAFIDSEFIRISFDSSQVILTFDEGEIVVETKIDILAVSSGFNYGTLSPSKLTLLNLTELIGQRICGIEVQARLLTITFSVLRMEITIKDDGYESVAVYFSSKETHSLFF